MKKLTYIIGLLALAFSVITALAYSPCDFGSAQEWEDEIASLEQSICTTEDELDDLNAELSTSTGWLVDISNNQWPSGVSQDITTPPGDWTQMVDIVESNHQAILDDITATEGELAEQEYQKDEAEYAYAEWLLNGCQEE